MVLMCFEPQTCIFGVRYQKNKSFHAKVLYCTNKNKTKMCLDHWPGARLARASIQGHWSRNMFFVFWYSTTLLHEMICFCWYSTTKMKVWASKTNKTIMFYFFKTADRFYSYSTPKIEPGVTKTNKKHNVVGILSTQSFIFAVLYQ